MDEPFGALDAKVRLELRRWLRQLHDEVGVTSVFVTHDQDEALEVADQVAVMNHGRIEQVGTPDEVYNRPARSFVYNFLGNVNLFHGRVDDGTAYINDERDRPSRLRPSALAGDRAPARRRQLLPRGRQAHQRGGPPVKVEAVTDWGAPVHVEIPQERFRALAIRKGEEIFVMPRDIAVFANDQRRLAAARGFRRVG